MWISNVMTEYISHINDNAARQILRLRLLLILLMQKYAFDIREVYVMFCAIKRLVKYSMLIAITTFFWNAFNVGRQLSICAQ